MTSKLTIKIDANELSDKTEKGYVLAVARMIENTYSSVWDARVPSSLQDGVYTWTANYAIAAADDEMDASTNAPVVTSTLKPISPGQSVRVTDNSEDPVVTGNDGGHSCTYQNNRAKTTRAILFQDLKVDGLLAPRVDQGGNAVGISPSVDSRKSVQVTPRWNVYAGDDGLGADQDSIAVWWVKGDSVNNNGPIDDKNGPKIEDPQTVVFCMPVGKTATLKWDASGVWTATVKA